MNRPPRRQWLLRMAGIGAAIGAGWGLPIASAWAGAQKEEQLSDAVRTALLAAKAEAEPKIAPHHPQPGRSSAARPWGEIVARAFKLKG